MKYGIRACLVVLFSVLLIQPAWGQSRTVQAVEAEIKQLVAGRDMGFYYESIESGESYALNAGNRYQSASTTKLPVVLCAYQLAADGKLDLNDKMAYGPEFRHGGSGIIQYEPDGTVFTIRKLVQYAVKYSDNVAYDMLRAKIGDAALYRYIDRINAVFVNNFNSQEVAVYMKAVYDFAENNGALGEEFLSFFVHTAFENRIPAATPDLQVAHKIGYLTGPTIYHDAAVVYETEPYILVIMTRGAKNNAPAFFTSLSALIHERHVLLNGVEQVKPGALTVGGHAVDVPGAFIDRESDRLMIPLYPFLALFNIETCWDDFVKSISFNFAGHPFIVFTEHDRLFDSQLQYSYPCDLTVRQGVLYIPADIIGEYLGVSVALCE